MPEHEHAELLRLIDKLGTARAAGASKARLVEIFEEVLDYTRVHLADEETLMQRLHYPGLAPHRQAHAQLVAQIAELLLKLRAADREAAAETEHFLRRGLTAHFDSLDHDFHRFLAERRDGP